MCSCLLLIFISREPVLVLFLLFSFIYFVTAHVYSNKDIIIILILGDLHISYFYNFPLHLVPVFFLPSPGFQRDLDLPKIKGKSALIGKEPGSHNMSAFAVFSAAFILKCEVIFPPV